MKKMICLLIVFCILCALACVNGDAEKTAAPSVESSQETSAVSQENEAVTGTETETTDRPTTDPIRDCADLLRGRT